MPSRHSEGAGAEPCSISGCKDQSERSLSFSRVEGAFPKGSLNASHGKAKLCKKHYKEWKKATKDERELDHLGW
ncbi:MAG: hypothetical protein ACT4PT_13775 [Methanobacteriota archaeon]